MQSINWCNATMTQLKVVKLDAETVKVTILFPVNYNK